MLVSALYGGRQLYSGSAQACSSLCSCSSAKGRALQCIGQQGSGKGGEARREGGQAGITAAFPRSRAQIGTCPAHDHHHHGDGEDDHDGDNDGDSDGDDDGDGDGDGDGDDDDDDDDDGYGDGDGPVLYWQNHFHKV